ncbi:CopD family protein [Halodurantibacterium flavum]|uniref:CopD family protein n=1 Tax=Halodurantibacterium flavum TaxID=1382802 RepID=A0ABW4S4H1_9RHOB
MTWDIVLWLTKFAHVSAIALWAGGMIVLPFLFRQRSHVEGDEEHRLHRLTRFLYVTLMSPAAFIAVGTGIGLIFLRETFVEWFSLKLAAVGVLAGMHVLSGLLVLKLFDTDERVKFGWPRTWVMTVVNLGAVGAILFLVLAKPGLDANRIAEIFAPGALRELVMPLIASVTR